jgi:hypothetical protein
MRLIGLGSAVGQRIQGPRRRAPQAKDLDDRLILSVLLRNRECWWMSWPGFTHSLPDSAPELAAVPWKVLNAKLTRMMARALIDGCKCGCRGDWHIPALYNVPRGQRWQRWRTTVATKNIDISNFPFFKKLMADLKESEVKLLDFQRLLREELGDPDDLAPTVEQTKAAVMRALKASGLYAKPQDICVTIVDGKRVAINFARLNLEIGVEPDGPERATRETGKIARSS